MSRPTARQEPQPGWEARFGRGRFAPGPAAARLSLFDQEILPFGRHSAAIVGVARLQFPEVVQPDLPELSLFDQGRGGLVRRVEHGLTPLTLMLKAPPFRVDSRENTSLLPASSQGLPGYGARRTFRNPETLTGALEGRP